jgi:hypothetical protein
MPDEDGHPQVEWSSQLEGVISSVGEKSLSYMWLHNRCQKRYTTLDNWVNVPVIIASTIAGAASVGSDSLFKGFDKASVVIGVISILVGILNTVGSYFAWAKRSEGHRIASLQYGKIYNFIKIELSLPREQRLPPNDFLKIVKEQIERLTEVSPQVADKIIAQYKKEFANYTDVAKPEICNGLDKIEVYHPKICEALESKRESLSLQIHAPLSPMNSVHHLIYEDMSPGGDDSSPRDNKPNRVDRSDHGSVTSSVGSVQKMTRSKTPSMASKTRK